MKKILKTLFVTILILCITGCSTISKITQKEAKKEDLQVCLQSIDITIDNWQQYFVWQDITFNPKDEFGDYTGETQGYRSLRLIDDSYSVGSSSDDQVVFKIYSNYTYSYFDPNYPNDNYYYGNDIYEDETTYTYYKNSYSDNNGQWYEGSGIDFQTLWQDRTGYKNITKYNVLTVNKVKGKIYKFNMNPDLFNDPKDFGGKTASELGRYVYRKVKSGTTSYDYYIFENGYEGYVFNGEENINDPWDSFNDLMIRLATAY